MSFQAEIENRRIQEGTGVVAPANSCPTPDVSKPLAEILTLSITFPWSELHTTRDSRALRELRREVTETRRSTAIGDPAIAVRWGARMSQCATLLPLSVCDDRRAR